MIRLFRPAANRFFSGYKRKHFVIEVDDVAGTVIAVLVDSGARFLRGSNVRHTIRAARRLGWVQITPSELHAERNRPKRKRVRPSKSSAQTAP